MFGMTRGEIILVAIVFGLIYGAGLLPKLVALLAGREQGEDGDEGAAKAKAAATANANAASKGE